MDDDSGLTPEQKKVLAATSFDEWEEYEDEWVKLRYPKHPEVKFHVSKSGAGLKVEGGVMTTVDNSFQQAYVLKVGEATYGVFLFQPAEWLDDGICFCGPMVHHAYEMRDGCLVRYSLLPGGAVKKAQVLGGGVRLMAFEWTHLACPREIYEQLVDGMRVKIRHPWDEKRLKEKVIDEYGFSGKAGWLHPGLPGAEMVALMGEPKKREERLWKWEERAEDYLVELEAEVRDGSFLSFRHNGVRRTSGPLEGSLTWVEKNVQEESDSDESDGEKEDAPKVETFAAALVKLAPTCHGYDWRRWCDAVGSLAENRKHRDPALLAIVKERADARGCELEVLETYEEANLKDWVRNGLERLAALEFRESDASDGGGDSPSWRGRDASELLAWQTEHDSEAVAASARLLLGARRKEWVTAVLEQGEALPADLGTEVLVQALEFAIQEKDGELVAEVFDKLPEMEMSDPGEVRKMVEKLPEGKEGTQWHKDRMDAIKVLSPPGE